MRFSLGHEKAMTIFVEPKFNLYIEGVGGFVGPSKQ